MAAPLHFHTGPAEILTELSLEYLLTVSSWRMSIPWSCSMVNISTGCPQILIEYNHSWSEYWSTFHASIFNVYWPTHQLTKRSTIVGCLESQVAQSLVPTWIGRAEQFCSNSAGWLACKLASNVLINVSQAKMWHPITHVLELKLLSSTLLCLRKPKYGVCIRISGGLLESNSLLWRLYWGVFWGLLRRIYWISRHWSTHWGSTGHKCEFGVILLVSRYTCRVMAMIHDRA